MINTKQKAVTLFQSTDSDAPKLTNKSGSLIALLDACLIDGYGSKKPLGWEKAYSGSNSAAYRSTNVSSNRHFLRVENSTTKYATVMGCRSMSAIDDVSDSFAYPDNFSRFGYIEQVQSTNAGKWFLIGHDKAFTLLVSSIDGGFSECLIFGDFPTVVPNDTGNTLFYSGHYHDYEYHYPIGMVTNNYYINDSYARNMLIAKHWDGTPKAVSANLISLMLHDSCHAPYPDRITGGLQAAECYLLESNNQGNNTTVFDSIRGLLAGFFKCGQSLNNLPDGSVIKIDGSNDNYLKFKLGRADRFFFLINASYWADNGV